MLLIEFVDRTLRAKTEDDLMAVLDGFLRERGVEVWSYHVLMEHLVGLQMHKGFIHSTFPDAWVEAYTRGRHFDHDPIIAHAHVADGPFAWWDVEALPGLTPRQRDYLSLARRHLAGGYGIPVHGAHGTVAYFGVGTLTTPLTLEPTVAVTIQLACHQTHTRFLQINGALEVPPPRLTKREIEVLTWVARGKSNAVIAQILGVSDHTVNTLLRRIYGKFGVGDRVSAVLRAVGCGLITP